MCKEAHDGSDLREREDAAELRESPDEGRMGTRNCAASPSSSSSTAQSTSRRLSDSSRNTRAAHEKTRPGAEAKCASSTPKEDFPMPSGPCTAQARRPLMPPRVWRTSSIACVRPRKCSVRDGSFNSRKVDASSRSRINGPMSCEHSPAPQSESRDAWSAPCWPKSTKCSACFARPLSESTANARRAPSQAPSSESPTPRDK
mmetsp:Transcript_124510/g.346621  ORF Transcript_124510/g.346621 Transcript_124510/m.346621 type:complete len:202 (+) Transcript_124510:778-1383(+)